MGPLDRLGSSCETLRQGIRQNVKNMLHVQKLDVQNLEMAKIQICPPDFSAKLERYFHMKCSRLALKYTVKVQNRNVLIISDLNVRYNLSLLMNTVTRRKRKVRFDIVWFISFGLYDRLA